MTNKIKGLTKKEGFAIEEFKNAVLEKFPKRVSRIILFGSKARGTSTRDSDVDLLVVISKDGKEVRREIVSLTHEPIVRFAVLLSPITIEEKEFKTWSPFLAQVKKEGTVLWTNKKKNT